jgi:hypothetical protein
MLDPHIQSTIETVVWDVDSRVKGALQTIVSDLGLSGGVDD